MRTRVAHHHHGSHAARHTPARSFGARPVQQIAPDDPDTLCSRATFGEAGLRFVGAVPRDLPTRPVRVYVALRTAPTPEARVDLAMRELERTGAFRRKVLLVAVPTGAGHVNPVLLELVDRMARGDSASVAIQFGTLPSFLSMTKVDDGAEVHRQLMLRIAARLRELYPNGGGPRVLEYGESLGAWCAERMLTAGNADPATSLAQLGAHRTLLVGVPGFASLTPNDLPPGVMHAFTPETGHADIARRAATATGPQIFTWSHLDDPVHRIATSLLWRRPEWNPRGGRKPAGVAPGERWQPVVSFVQTAMDLVRTANHTTPGKFTSESHDYRADLPTLARDAFGFSDVSDADLAHITALVARSEVWTMDQPWGELR